MSLKPDNKNYIMQKSNLSIFKVYSINGYVDGSIQCPTQFLQDSARNITLKKKKKKFLNFKCGIFETKQHSTLSSTPPLHLRCCQWW
jgi:hypothetical protein